MASRYPYQATVSHNGLNKSKIVKAATQSELDYKINELRVKWNSEWDAIESADQAKRLTLKAEETQEALDNILLNSLNPVPYNLERLKDKTPFPEARPEYPELEEVPEEPKRTDEVFNPQLSWLARLSKKKKELNAKQNDEEFAKCHSVWVETKDTIEKNNTDAMAAFEAALADWEKRKENYREAQAVKNQRVDRIPELLRTGDKDTVEDYYTLVLEDIDWPMDVEHEVSVDYNPETKNLLVELLLPTMDSIPRVKSVNYIKTRSEFKESYYPESYIKKKYDRVIYQIVLQILNYVFSLSKGSNIIDAIVVNGRIHTIDKTTGKEIDPCILSISVSRDSFDEINLAGVDPTAWFKSAKGVSAASLATVTPVAPIISISREDSRFIEGYSVDVDNCDNLAAIDWKDFENLIRELFEKEFSYNGGEVKITQASRDGGVDAVAFDPDPIRGGKIVIQAKRYTNTVGVSAVRDLYGTVLNEGATKGILVTTSNYGNDAYDFAIGKPLTLLNGGNLLSLLEKHGYNARIDLKEAKYTLYGKS